MTRQFATTTLIFLTAVAISLPAMAQDNRGRRGGPGARGGFGGPGGFNRSSDMLMLGLLRAGKVREEIELMPNQEEAFRKLVEQNREQRPDFGRLRDASPEERREMMEEMRENMEKQAKESREKMEEILLPEQMTRLNEIAIQQMGTAALSDPDVVAALNITDEQQKKMDSIRQELGNQMREMFSGVDRDRLRERREEMREKMNEAREKSEKDVLGVLTSDQMIKFDEMKGEPFEMPEARGFGPGARRGGDGARRGRDGARRGRDGARRGGRPDQNRN